MAKTKWKKIIVAGPLVLESVYPAANRWDTPRARAAKSKLSSEAQQRMNRKYSYQKLELMLAANFRPGDLVCTLTYDDAHLPRDRAAASEKLKAFRESLSKLRRKSGDGLRMIWCTEHKHGDGRWHHHAVINATGDDYRTILAAWRQGEIEIKPLRVDKDKNYETLARYMTKEAPGNSKRAWSYTRSCRKPEVETFRVEDDATLQAPKGATTIEDESRRTEYGSYRYIKYLYEGAGLSRVLARRRRPKR